MSFLNHIENQVKSGIINTKDALDMKMNYLSLSKEEKEDLDSQYLDKSKKSSKNSTSIAGDIKSFVTAQKFNQITMPYKFYNINQIIKFIKKRGYELILRNNYQVNFNGVLSLLPTKKFPKESRLQYSSNLIFKKNET